jgi:hypothetical protein
MRSVYRTPPPTFRWVAEAVVLGPLNSFLMASVLEARDEQEVIERFTTQMIESGFQILSEVRAARAG